MVLAVIVPETVLFGIASSIEAAGVGAAGVGVTTAHQRRLNWNLPLQAGQTTLRATAMVL